MSSVKFNANQNFCYPPPLFVSLAYRGVSPDWTSWSTEDEAKFLRSVKFDGMGGEMGQFVWNSMYKCAGLLLTHRGGPGAVGSRWAALRFPPGAQRQI